MNKALKIGIISAIVVVGIGLASPLFYETQVDEPLPVMLDRIQPGMTFEKFVQMDDVNRKPIVEKMSDKIKDMIMQEATSRPNIVEEPMQDSNIQILKMGVFEGLLGHFATGEVKLLEIDGKNYLRFENFEVTNGPDLRVYLTKDGDVKNGFHIDKLKGSKGNQNYLLDGVNLEQYNTVVVYCQPFGVHFGQAKIA